MINKLRVLLAVVALTVTSGAALAHHGWAWTTGGNIELSGVITEVNLGYPHGIVMVSANGDVWTVEVGQPWRNERSGLKEGDLAVGVEGKFIGQPSANIEDRLLKVERLSIGGTLYNLYPNRD